MPQNDQALLGKLVCLGEVAGIGSFDAVLRRSTVAKFSDGDFRFLNLDALIEAKQAMGREHDLAALRQLRVIKERRDLQLGFGSS